MYKNSPNYEKLYIRELRKNDLEVVDLLQKQDVGLLKKIRKFAKKHGFGEKGVAQELKTNKYFRATFSKDPGKQKIHENIAAKFIKKINGVSNFKQLPTGATLLLGGGLISKKEVVKLGARGKAKTIDFEWRVGNNHIVASHKYTKEGGGAQDNQYKDLQDFINEANRSNLKNTYFLAIADGEYYKTKDTGAGVTKLDFLKGLANRRNVHAMSINELGSWLEQLK